MVEITYLVESTQNIEDSYNKNTQNAKDKKRDTGDENRMQVHNQISDKEDDKENKTEKKNRFLPKII